MRVRIFVQISAMEQDPPRAVLRGDYLWRWDVVKIRQHSIMHDPAVNAAFLNGWTPTPVPGAPPAPPGESERDEEGPLNLQFGPIVVEQVLSPGASRTVDLQVPGPSVLVGSARWIGTINPLQVAISLGTSALATGTAYHFGPDRGGSVLQTRTSSGGSAKMSVTNTSGVRVKVRIVFGAGKL
jgi:hypothetical protein